MAVCLLCSAAIWAICCYSGRSPTLASLNILFCWRTHSMLLVCRRYQLRLWGSRAPFGVLVGPCVDLGRVGLTTRVWGANSLLAESV